MTPVTYCHCSKCRRWHGHVGAYTAVDREGCEAGSEPVMWGTGHPVGYWAHDVGPALSGAQKGLPAKGASARLIRPGQVFAFDGFFAWKLPTPGGTKTISVEEMAVVTEAGAEYLIPPQEELILIPSSR